MLTSAGAVGAGWRHAWAAQQEQAPAPAARAV